MPKKPQEAKVNINLDSTPILYTDRIQVTVSDNGVVINVMQQIGNSNQARIVSRIGMSKTHALKFSQELGKLLAMTQGSRTTKAN